ncbi:hypothetical protein CCOS865_04864 [Pseudomonas reidholzensis]|uniref:N-acetyltransferase domain-containing protein n=1 Tax=Pseudomonas reidholzensis TaxID=1785162 RepID=A0A383S1J2_9PSED|nr:GNAT family N-acetyltransferase [Pseudomonas reidholzensis]SYX92576.1 hypothetical protein CCOS865_04864 [Pseudomonas reidholzensis]
MPLPTIEQIRPVDCLALRRDVLWPDLTAQQCAVEGDEQARHFGIHADGQLVSCLSLFEIAAASFQIRKFATASGFQQQGLGTALLTHAIAQVRAQGGQRIVLNARTSACAFYARHGFSRFGEVSQRDGVSFVSMGLDLR